MEIPILVGITVVVGLTVSSLMFYAANSTVERPKAFDGEKRNYLFRRLKLTADRIK